VARISDKLIPSDRLGTISGRVAQAAAVMADNQAAQAAGIRERPVFDINGTRIVGARPYAT
jgi:predicted DsbA family dithiol-disulfide isomerase